MEKGTAMKRKVLSLFVILSCLGWGCAMTKKAPDMSSASDTYTNSLGMTFVYIKPGTFMMGSPSDEVGRYDNETQHQVTLTRGFWLQTTEVTQKQWLAVMGNNPSKAPDCGDDCPVDQVSWDDAQAFIQKLNQRGDDITYGLPTEAQWEYAARAGSTGMFSFGDTEDQLSEYAWCSNFNKQPNNDLPVGERTPNAFPVGQKLPNAWGLYDMHGNLWEWCQDWLGDYPSGPVTDPTGPATGEKRVHRSGSWEAYTKHVRSANRGGEVTDVRNRHQGIRVAGH